MFFSMSSCFRVLCALSDQRALCVSNEEVEKICDILLEGSNSPIPNLTNVRYLLTVLQEIHDCLARDEPVSTSTTYYSREPSLLKRTMNRESTKTNTITTRESVASSILSKSMLDHPIASSASTEELIEADLIAARDPPQKKTQRAACTKDLAEKNQYAIDKYVERMNRAYIMRTGPTRLETLNGDVPLSRRRAREIRSTQELERYLDSWDTHQMPISSHAQHQQG